MDKQQQKKLLTEVMNDDAKDGLYETWEDIEQEYLKDEYALGHAIGRTKNQVIEAVFGEFRQDFRLIEKHLYNYEFEEAATALRRMEDKMFSTED